MTDKDKASPADAHEAAKLNFTRLSKPGAQHRKMLRDALTGVSDDAMAALLINIKAGDSQALNIWANRVLPQPKSTMEPVKFKLPPKGSILEKCEAVLQAIADGQLPPDIGLNMITALGAIQKVIESEELAKQLEELKAMVEALNGNS